MRRGNLTSCVCGCLSVSAICWNSKARTCYYFFFQNRGIYMFRLDEDRVVDATLSGGLARYINHSCNPNCVAEIVEVERDLRIIIFAKRRISRGEEVSVMATVKSLFLYLQVDHSLKAFVWFLSSFYFFF